MAKAIDTTHVRNVGEFYSQHYLDAVLPDDLQTTLSRWDQRESDGGPKTPERRLAALAEPYFKALAEHQARDEAGRRVEIAAGFHARVIEALGYERAPQGVLLPDGRELPVAVAVALQGKPYLWIVEAGFPVSEDDADPLGAVPLRVGAEGEGDGDDGSDGLPPWRELLDGPVLRQEHAPRWVILLAGPDAFLVDRDKWAQGQYLAFGVGAMLGQRKPAALRALAGLLHRDVLVPEGGRSLLDEIDEKSHKHAFAVSTDLKHGVQKAIELIGNEVVWYKSEVSHEKLYDRPELAGALSRECITYLYRLLFLFYVEARGGEVGVVPMKAEAYRHGLSLESLRDLELVPLSTERAQNGYYLHHSLTKLFEVVHLGWPTKRQRDIGAQFADAVDLTVPPQRSPLFDRARMPITGSVKLRNFVLQRVIALLSLSKEGKRGGGAGGRQRGRISYAQLGINQLGAVYEGLLSYTGFFTQEETFEIRNPKDKDEDARVYYVGRSKIDEYREEEFRKTKSGKKISYPKGTFLFRLAGRDREKSASYYTPEVLTKCLTKYTLKERLGVVGEDGALSADEILGLTVCEPAMGSGAFLNEAVGQLAHAYLERKQAERGEMIAAEEYQREWARVKYWFVVHNCYGVDLNPLAAELGKVSLWLGVLQPGVQAPYLDLRLRVGNSLIGARREVYSADELMRKPNKKAGVVNWLGKAPERVKAGEERPAGSVYHFLVPDEGMSPYEKDKVVAGLCPKEIAGLKKWRKEMKQPFTAMEVKRLQGLCRKIDALWEEHRRVREGVLEKVRQLVVVWGQEAKDAPVTARWKTAEECEVAARELWKPSSPGARLKALMDYWCGLWMWPVERTNELPTREAWLAKAEELLERGATEKEVRAQDGRFMHWELEFSEVFGRNGGFDVILGNPPWIKLEWKEASILGDMDPLLHIRKNSANEVATKRNSILSENSSRPEYLSVFCADTGAQSFLGAKSNFPLLSGVKTNLYKCFIVRGAEWISSIGSSGLFHQTGIFDDPNGGHLRQSLLYHWRIIARFKNELRLFAEIKPERTYCLSVLSGQKADLPHFTSFCEIYHPRTIDSSLSDDGLASLPMIKTDNGVWNLTGHKSRAVSITEESLRLFTSLYDPPETPWEEARVPVVYSQEFIPILNQFRRNKRTLASLSPNYFFTTHFDETARQRDKTIRRKTQFPSTPNDWIISGPHFYVATPISKTPRAICRLNTDYDTIDHTQLSPQYLPRTNYIPACQHEAFLSRIPRWNGVRVTERYRCIYREMVAPTGERTLITAIIPPGPGHIHTNYSIAFKNNTDLLDFAGFSHSIVADLFAKSTGMGHINKTTAERLPLTQEPWRSVIHDRTLRLNCLTTHYTDLWTETLPTNLYPSAKSDRRTDTWESASKKWSPEAPFRTPFARRQALVEIDALCALVLGLTVDELILSYRTYFRILRGYEADTFYDQRGKIVFTKNSKGLSGVGLTRAQWTPLKDATANTPLPDYARDATGPFVPPFDRCDREADMAQAYAYFQKLLP